MKNTKSKVKSETVSNTAILRINAELFNEVYNFDARIKRLEEKADKLHNKAMRIAHDKQVRTNHRIAIRTYLDDEDIDRTRTPFSQAKMITYVATKRIFDTSIAMTGLILLSPIMAAIAVAIKLEDGGPVLFKQPRTGKFGKEFNIYKFRSMSVDNDIHNFSKSDQVTRVGEFLRKTSLDELPQLFCIVSQKMSIIGPRPWISDYYKYMNDLQRRRYDVRPGLTGLAQCSGRNDLTIFDKINYDREYIKNYSLAQDIKVVYKTVDSVLHRTGIGDGKQTVKQELGALKRTNKNRV